LTPAPLPPTIPKQPTPPLMTYANFLHSVADDCGTIPWIAARRVAIEHGLFEDFRIEYGTTQHFGRVDVGEFLVWLGY